jgi:hypothetical protein
LIKDFSADLSGIGLVVYELGTFSRFFSARAAAAACTVAETFGRVAGLFEPGFNGSGGGALSGSALSHLDFQVSMLASSQLAIGVPMKYPHSALEWLVEGIHRHYTPARLREGVLMFKDKLSVTRSILFH